MRFSILMYDGVTALDAIGGYEVLARIPGIETEFVAMTPGIIVADTRRLGLLAFRALSEVSATDILYVPGGPGAARLETDAVFLEHLRRLDHTSTWTVGICNGVGLLAQAGLLRGRAAATNWFYRERLAAAGVEFVPERYHRSGKYVTSAGVSASIDASLFLADLIAGEQVAKAIQLGLEYYPAPPFPERAVQDAPLPLQAMVQAFEATAGKDLLLSAAPFSGQFGIVP